MIFKSYNTGQQFIEENKDILEKHPIETRFFKYNAMNMKDMSNGFAVKVINDDKYVLALQYDIFSMVIYGDDSLLDFLASELVKGQYHFNSILAAENTAKQFINIYEKLAGGTHQILYSMDIMLCKHINENNIDTSIVENACVDDIQEIAENLLLFHAEIGQDQFELPRLIDDVKNSIENFVLIRKDNKIVSLAKSCQEDDKVCAVSDVFTRKEYRGNGFAKKIMIFISNKILKKGKYPYLFVDKTNALTNHLYSSVGYDYLSPIMEIKYLK